MPLLIRSRGGAAIAASALALGLLAGCSGGSDATSGTAPGQVEQRADQKGDDMAGGAEPQATKAPGAAPGSTDGQAAPEAVDPTRKLVRQADVTIEAKNLPEAASRVRALATTNQGLVTSEEVSVGEQNTGYGTITISVPSEKLDSTLDQLAKSVGTMTARNVSTQDVTQAYTDTEARLGTMRASVKRVQALMDKADKISDIVSLEGELSRRQADVDSLQSQLNTMKDQVALSPITVKLSVPGADTLVEPGDDTGFVAGLKSGWRAFNAALSLLLTMIGALLPFAIAFAILAAPLWLWWRRRPRRERPGPPAQQQPQRPTQPMQARPSGPPAQGPGPQAQASGHGPATSTAVLERPEPPDQSAQRPGQRPGTRPDSGSGSGGDAGS